MGLVPRFGSKESCILLMGGFSHVFHYFFSLLPCLDFRARLKKLQISLKKFLENLNSVYRPMHTNIEIFRKEEPICSII